MMTTYRIDGDIVYVITDLGDGYSKIEEITPEAPEYGHFLELAQEASK